MIYYVKEGQSSIFFTMKFSNNECEITKKISNTTKKKKEKIAKKMKKNGIEKIVLSKEIKQNKEFIEQLNNYDITIFDGKWLMQYILEDIINFLSKNKKITSMDEITILANDLTIEVRENIKKFAGNYKKIRIVTNHIEKFKKLEEELYNNKGISIIITNNKRKALTQSMLIINFDFVQEIINQYNINEKAVIINLCDKIKINKKRFSGVIITDYEVEFQNMNQEPFEDLEKTLQKQKEFCLKEILEEKTYSDAEKMPNYNIFEQIEESIKKYNFQVKELYGTKGLLT